MDPHSPIALGLTFDDVLLVPQSTRAQSRKLVEVSTRLTKSIHIALPVLSANIPWCTGATMAIELGRLGGFGILHRMMDIQSQVAMVRHVRNAHLNWLDNPNATRSATGGLLIGASIGARPEEMERAHVLVDEGVNVIAVDVAHGHAEWVVETVRGLKARWPDLQVIAGNVATREGTLDLIEAGADAVKVGIGPGGVCTTRVVAGAGMPQITAVMDCSHAARELGVPIIADGGVRSSGDMAKALAAGASSVMLGSIIAGTDESEAKLVERDGLKYKVTTGFVSLGARLTLKRSRGEAITEEELEAYVPEGVEATFKYAGPLARLVGKLIGGLQSGMSYSGATSMGEFHEKARFVRVSEIGQRENRPHAIESSPQLEFNYHKAVLAPTSISDEQDAKFYDPEN